jgi:hypothetical protein
MSLKEESYKGATIYTKALPLDVLIHVDPTTYPAASSSRDVGSYAACVYLWEAVLM